jgi:hypothetical protein
MRAVLFFSRVGFICNVLFLLAWVNRYYQFLFAQDLVGTVVILGYGAFFLNILLMIVYAVQLPRGLLGKSVPLWLAASNTGIFFLQIFYFFISNDT